MADRVEEFDLGETAQGADNPDATQGRERRTAGRRSGAVTWVAAAATLVGVGVAAAEPVVVLESGTGISIGMQDVDIRAAPRLAWEVDLESAQLLGQTAEVAVFNGVARTTESEVLAIDLESGDAVWSYTSEAPGCQWGEPVVCVEGPGTARARVVLLDPTTGAIERQDHPRALAGIAVDDGLVLALATTGTREEIVRLDADGTELWRTTAEAVETESTPPWTYMRVVGEMIEFLGGPLDIQTGGTRSGGLFPIEGYDEDGAAVIVEIERGPTGLDRVYTPDAVIELLPEEVVTRTNDLGGPVVLLSRADGLEALSRSSGRTLWQRSGDDCTPHAILAPAVLLVCTEVGGEAFYAVDPRTGRELWRLDAGGWPVLLTTETVLYHQDQGRSLVAIEVTTGAQRWVYELPGALLGTIAPTPDGLLVLGHESVVKLAF